MVTEYVAVRVCYKGICVDKGLEGIISGQL